VRTECAPSRWSTRDETQNHSNTANNTFRYKITSYYDHNIIINFEVWAKKRRVPRSRKIGCALLLLQSALLLLGARSQKFRAHSERIKSGYKADTERRCVEEQRRSHWLGARSQKFKAHSERIQSGYRAHSERVQSGSRAKRALVRRKYVRHRSGASKRSEVIFKMEFSTYEERWKLVFSARKRLCCALLSSLCTTTQSKGPPGALPKILGIKKHLLKRCYVIINCGFVAELDLPFQPSHK